MKPLWMQTLAWIVAILVAVLFAFANPDADTTHDSGSFIPHGSIAPR
jgi:hypothetical protein